MLDQAPPDLFRVADVIGRFLSYCIVEDSVACSSHGGSGGSGSADGEGRRQYQTLFVTAAAVWSKYINVFPTSLANKVQLHMSVSSVCALALILLLLFTEISLGGNWIYHNPVPVCHARVVGTAQHLRV